MMNSSTKKGRKYIFMGILITSMGVVFNTVLREQIEGLGIVVIAFGGVMIITGILKKRREEGNRT